MSNPKNKFKIKIPTGYLMVEEKGTEDEYPGVWVSFSKDGKSFTGSQIVACVEFDSTNEAALKDEENPVTPEDLILVETYTAHSDDPAYIIKWGTGEDKM